MNEWELVSARDAIQWYINILTQDPTTNSSLSIALSRLAPGKVIEVANILGATEAEKVRITLEMLEQQLSDNTDASTTV